MRLSIEDARARFVFVPTVALATVDEAGRPHLVVTTFALEGDVIYTAVDQKPKSTRELKRIRNIRGNSAVAALADHYDEDWNELWWVRADGRADIVSEPLHMAAPIQLLAARYPQYRADPPLGPVIAIAVTKWTGWAY